MRIVNADVLNQGDFLEDILCLIPFVQAAVNDGERQRVAVLKQNEGRLLGELVDLTRNLSKLATGVRRTTKLYSKEEIRKRMPLSRLSLVKIVC